MSGILTEEMVEKHAKAIWDAEEAEDPGAGDWDGAPKHWREQGIRKSRAALEAVLPLIGKEIAKGFDLDVAGAIEAATEK